MADIPQGQLNRLYTIATTFHVMSRTPKDEAYFPGYLPGLRRRMIGGATQHELGVQAFAKMETMDDTVCQQRGLGNKDGLAGLSIVAREG